MKVGHEGPWRRSARRWRSVLPCQPMRLIAPPLSWVAALEFDCSLALSPESDLHRAIFYPPSNRPAQPSARWVWAARVFGLAAETAVRWAGPEAAAAAGVLVAATVAPANQRLGWKTARQSSWQG